MPDSAAPPPPPLNPLVELDRREHAELTFQRNSIHIQDRRWGGWIPRQGDLDRELNAEDFYRTVGRPDLAEKYHRDRTTGLVIAGIGAAGLVTAGVLTVAEMAGGNDDCSSLFPGPAFSMCVDNNIRNGENKNFTPSLVLAGASLVAILVGAAYATPTVNVDEAKSLADTYNQHLRGQLGLPRLASQPWLRDVKLMPYTVGRDTGLALGGRF